MTFSEKAIPPLSSLIHYGMTFFGKSYRDLSPTICQIGMTLLNKAIPNIRVSHTHDFGMTFLHKVIPTIQIFV